MDKFPDFIARDAFEALRQETLLTDALRVQTELRELRLYVVNQFERQLRSTAPFVQITIPKPFSNQARSVLVDELMCRFPKGVGTFNRQGQFAPFSFRAANDKLARFYVLRRGKEEADAAEFHSPPHL